MAGRNLEDTLSTKRVPGPRNPWNKYDMRCSNYSNNNSNNSNDSSNSNSNSDTTCNTNTTNVIPLQKSIAMRNGGTACQTAMLSYGAVCSKL